MFCLTCFASTRVFGACTQCGPRPNLPENLDPLVRWFLDTLANEPEYTLSDEACRLIQFIIREGGAVHEGHVGFKDTWDRRLAEAAANSPEATAEGVYVGEPGKRWEGQVRCVSIKQLPPGQWGERYLIVFEADGPATLVWFTGDGGKFAPEEGGSYRVSAIVHKINPHGIYNGVRQTKVQRVKLLEEESDD